MSQRPGGQTAARRAASTGTGKRVLLVRSGCICPSRSSRSWVGAGSGGAVVRVVRVRGGWSCSPWGCRVLWSGGSRSVVAGRAVPHAPEESQSTRATTGPSAAVRRGWTMRTPKWALDRGRCRRGRGRRSCRAAGRRPRRMRRAVSLACLRARRASPLVMGRRAARLLRAASAAAVCREIEHGLGAAPGEAVAPGAAEGVEEVLDQRVQGAAARRRGRPSPVSVAPAYGEGRGHGRQYAVAAVAEGGRGAVARRCSSRRGGRRRRCCAGLFA
ncbi:hypothetical protein SMICM17S_00509 [Streptomyces microflavus]